MPRINGTTGPDSLDGGEGDDTIRGLNGDDTIHGQGGSDSIDAGGGQDLLFGDDGDDRIDGEGGRDTIFGGDGADTLDGSGGATDTPGNELHGGAGRDLVFLVIGDTADGGGGRDRFALNLDHWSLGPDGHTEGVSIDFSGLDAHGEAAFLETTLASFEGGSFFATRLDDVLRAGSLGLRLDGNDGDDVLRAGGPSTLIGGEGDDVLVIKGAGAVLEGDVQLGVRGADSFVFRSVVALRATILDLGDEDTVDLGLIDADTTEAGNQAFVRVEAFTGEAGQLVVELVGDDTLVRVDRNGDAVADPAILTLSGDHGNFDNFAL